MLGLIGRKLGMTQVIDTAGQMVAVTAIKVGGSAVTKLLSKEKNGYRAVQIGFEESKEKRLNRSQIADLKKTNSKLYRHLREFRLPEGDKTEFTLGQELGVDIFEEGEFVDIHGRTIGRGFQGGMKRWNMRGGPASHGSMHHRRIGSAGPNTLPGRSFRGHHMPGHMGDDNQTTQNLLVLKIMKDDQVLLVRGSVPGTRNGLVTVTKSFKRKKIDLASLKPKMATVKRAEGAKTAQKKAAAPATAKKK